MQVSIANIIATVLYVANKVYIYSKLVSYGTIIVIIEACKSKLKVRTYEYNVAAI